MIVKILKPSFSTNEPFALGTNPLPTSVPDLVMIVIKVCEYVSGVKFIIIPSLFSNGIKTSSYSPLHPQSLEPSLSNSVTR